MFSSYKMNLLLVARFRVEDQAQFLMVSVDA